MSSLLLFNPAIACAVHSTTSNHICQLSLFAKSAYSRSGGFRGFGFLLQFAEERPIGRNPAYHSMHCRYRPSPGLCGLLIGIKVFKQKIRKVSHGASLFNASCFSQRSRYVALNQGQYNTANGKNQSTGRKSSSAVSQWIQRFCALQRKFIRSVDLTIRKRGEFIKCLG